MDPGRSRGWLERMMRNRAKKIDKPSGSAKDRTAKPQPCPRTNNRFHEAADDDFDDRTATSSAAVTVAHLFVAYK